MSDEKTYSPTDIANYVRLECCERYLWLKAGNENGSAQKPTLDKWLRDKGEDHEKEFQKHLHDIGIKQICLSKSGYSAPCSGNELQCFLDEYKKNFYQREVSIDGNVKFSINGEDDSLQLRGRIDFLICTRDSVYNRLIIAECKASVQDKTYQRIQAAVYALLLEEKFEGKPGEDIAPQVMVVRQSKKSGKLHTYELAGSRLILDPESQKEEPDDDEDNLPRPDIDDVELKALKEDIRTICKKIKDYERGHTCSEGCNQANGMNSGNRPNFQLLPRCGNCDFNSTCLEVAKTRADLTNGDFGFEILTYGAKAKKAIGSPTNLDEIKDPTNSVIHPPPEKLKGVRKAYYGLKGSEGNKTEVVKIDGRVPELPKPDESGEAFFQFFLCVEADPTNNNRLGAISLKKVKYPPDAGEATKTEETECWTKWSEQSNSYKSKDVQIEASILQGLVGSIRGFISGTSDFYAHFYFWSLSEKKLLAQACQQVIDDKEDSEDDAIKKLLGDIKNFLQWISRHPYLREPKQYSKDGNYIAANKNNNDDGLEIWEVKSHEELVCTQLQEEVRKCFALGCIGNTLLEVSCLNWDQTNWEQEWCEPAVNWILDGYPEGYEQTEPCALASEDSIRKKLRERQFYNDTLPPSVWDETDDAAKNVVACYFKKRVEILQELEAHVRSKFESPQSHFKIVRNDKVLNTLEGVFSDPPKDDSNLVTAAREMLLIETMHQKDRWLKEATEGFHQMESDQRSVKLVDNDEKKPKWKVW